jgi:hypothetical protein
MAVAVSEVALSGCVVFDPISKKQARHVDFAAQK